MYSRNLFSKHAKFLGEEYAIVFLPDFRQNVTVSCWNNFFSTDAGDPTIDENGRVFAPSEATWLIERTEWGSYTIFVTGRTRNIKLNKSMEQDQFINNLLKMARIEYSQKKYEEMRLYFYNSKEKRLKIISNYSYRNCSYDMNRDISNYSIDNEFETPAQDCFILARIKRTIGTKNGKLHDFLEPVKRLNLDFQDDSWQFYQEDIDELSKIILALWCFAIRQEYKDQLEKNRILAYISKSLPDVKREEAIGLFKEEVKKAFEKEDVATLRKLYDVLNQKMDCSKENFKVVAQYNVTDSIYIEYENGEQAFVDSRWVVLNRKRCVNAQCNYSVKYNEYVVKVIE